MRRECVVVGVVFLFLAAGCNSSGPLHHLLLKEHAAPAETPVAAAEEAKPPAPKPVGPHFPVLHRAEQGVSEAGHRLSMWWGDRLAGVETMMGTPVVECALLPVAVAAAVLGICCGAPGCVNLSGLGGVQGP
jgi:hypothetical protein